MKFWEPVVDFVSGNLLLFKVVSAAVSALFLWGIVHAVRGSRLINHSVEKLMDVFNVKTIAKRRAIQAWRQVKERMARGTETNYKLAILEADRILDEVLKLMALPGQTMDERLSQVTTEHMAAIEQLRRAHQVARRITIDPEFTVDATLGREVIKTYADLFSEYGIV